VTPSFSKLRSRYKAVVKKTFRYSIAKSQLNRQGTVNLASFFFF
jgi:hypothetical protein